MASSLIRLKLGRQRSSRAHRHIHGRLSTNQTMDRISAYLKGIYHWQYWSDFETVRCVHPLPCTWLWYDYWRPRPGQGDSQSVPLHAMASRSPRSSSLSSYVPLSSKTPNTPAWRGQDEKKDVKKLASWANHNFAE